MDSPLSWTGRQLAAFWAGVVTLVVLLLLECAWRAPSWEVAVAMASPSSEDAQQATVLAMLRVVPIEIVVVALVLLAALVVSVAWTAAHASRRVAQQIT